MLMRRLALALLLITGCATGPVTTEPSIRVMTYNIRLNLASDGPNAWPHRRDAVASLIRFHEADLLGVQEALPEQLVDLDARLPEYGRFGVGRTAERSGEHSAIYYRRDRFEVLQHDTFWLSETPELAGSKGWDGAYERIATWGHLRDRRTGARFYHFNTHLDHIGKVARLEGTRLITARIAELTGDAPVIVTGDFNDVPSSPSYATMTALLRDAFTVSQIPHHGPMSTWNAFRAIEPDRRIDFIFVRGFDVLRHGILSETIDGVRFPSDHLPVVAEVTVGD